jgi:CheY-like chemotaxis protein
MEMQLLNLNDLTASFTKMLRRVVGEHIRVQTDLAPTPPPIKADPGMIEQVLMNLAVNARDAMPKGGSLIIGTEVVEIGKDRAKLDSRMRAGHFACLSVRDTGTGIAPENMSRIFEPFFTTKEVGKGTGLGLATVFGIAEQHQGWVDVSSEAGVGTTFRVFFPLSEENVAASNLTVGQKVRGGTEKVLVVEDERGVRNVVVQTLENHGYTVVEADTAISAQKVWAEYGGQFDLVITDMVMPGGLNGLELIDLLRGQKPGLKALLTSGYSADLARNDLARAKGITFLHKPFSTRVLAESVRKCLDEN